MRRISTLLPLLLLFALPLRAEEEPEEYAFGSLYLKTEPPGAKVYFDGALLSRRTPVTVEDVPEGEHRLRLVAGQLSVKTTIYVIADDFREVFLDLAAPTGKLKVVTDPLEAEVCLDGASVGRTPVILPEVPFGLRRISINKPGFKPLEIEIAIRSPDQARVAVHLDPLSSGSVADDGTDDVADGGTDGVVPDGTAGGEPRKPGGRSTFSKVMPWIMLGVGAGLVGAGIGFEVHTADAVDAADGERQRYREAVRAKDILHHYDNAEHNRKIARDNEIVASVMFGAGGAVIVGGVLWLLLGGDDEAPPPATVEPTDDGAALMIRGRW